MRDDYRELLLGCGHDRRKRYVAIPHHSRDWQSAQGPVTLDENASVEPHLLCDLTESTPWHVIPLQNNGYARQDGYTLDSNHWDEIHAYEVLEHLGQQGDAFSFFETFSEIWRILKPGGYLVAEVPSRFSGNLWGDPGHTRAIVAETLVFLSQEQYRLQCDGPLTTRTSMSDYRYLYQADFKIVETHDDRKHFVFVLQAVKS